MAPPSDDLGLVKEPKDYDVLFGRGRGTRDHIGNRQFLAWVEQWKAEYGAAESIRAKEIIARRIVNAVKRQGRFLEREKDAISWHEVSFNRALTKTKQALREKPRGKDRSETTVKAFVSAKMNPPRPIASASVTYATAYGDYTYSQHHPPTSTWGHPPPLSSRPIWGQYGLQGQYGYGALPQTHLDRGWAHPNMLHPPGMAISMPVEYNGTVPPPTMWPNEYDFPPVAAQFAPDSVPVPYRQYQPNTRPSQTTESQVRRLSYDTKSSTAETVGSTDTTDSTILNSGSAKTSKRGLVSLSASLNRTQLAATVDKSQVEHYLERCAKADVPDYVHCSDAVQDDKEFFDAIDWSSDEDDTVDQLLDKTTWFTPEEMAREQTELSEEERMAALVDVFGAHCQIEPASKKRSKEETNGNTTPLGSLLKLMREQLDCMPDSRARSAYLKAKQNADPSEFSDGRLELFLRHENMNPQEAARRLVTYWDERQNVFGPDRFFLPMTLSSAAFQEGDHKALEAGLFQLLPRLDSSGRQIMMITWRNHSKDGYTSEDTTRAIWYMYEAALRHQNASKGVVHLVSAKGSSFSSFDWKILSTIPRVERNAFPIAICASHSCFVPVWITRVFAPTVLALFDTESRSRMVLHDVPDDELVENLRSFGFPRDAIPEEFGGECAFNQSVWLSKQKLAGK